MDQAVLARTAGVREEDVHVVQAPQEGVHLEGVEDEARPLSAQDLHARRRWLFGHGYRVHRGRKFRKVKD
jgi:hypothetical protein